MSDRQLTLPKKPMLRLKILLPLACGLLLFLACYTASTSWYLDRQIDRNLQRQIKSIQSMFQNLLEQRAELLLNQLTQLANEPQLKTLMRSGDRQGLYQWSKARFEILQETLNVSHFSFLSPDRTAFLRVHAPEEYGEQINRQTLLQAAKTGEAAHGLELGPLGSFSLRTVIPWFDGKERLGYLELGQDINLLIGSYFDRFETELIFTIDKKHLLKDHFAAQAHRLNRPVSWDFLVNSVVVQATSPNMLPALKEVLNSQARQKVQIEFRGRTFRGKTLPLFDATQREIGDFLILTEITEELADFHNALKFFIVLFAILGGGLLLFSAIVLGRTEKQLNTARSRLLGEMEKVQQSNLQLEREVEERKSAEEALNRAHHELEARVENRTEQLRLSLEQTQQARKQVTGILSSIADGLFVTTADGRLQLINSRAEALFGCPARTVIGKPLKNLIQDPALLKRMEEALSQELADLRIDFSQMSADLQKPVFLQARTSIISGKSGKMSGMIFLLHDISHEREMERIKSEFISTAVHELSTPLTAIVGYTELMLGEQNFTPQENLEFLTIVHEKAEFLSGLIGEMLDISRIESGKPLDLHKDVWTAQELFDRPIHHFRHFSELHEFFVDLSEPEMKMAADKEKIWQVMENLCSNAVKYSPEGGEIQVHGQPLENGYQVSITDQGIGMTQNQVARVFEKFYRCNQSDSSVEGTGLGMTIVKSIIEAHEGQVWLDSELGQGTSVHFVLPKS